MNLKQQLKSETEAIQMVATMTEQLLHSIATMATRKSRSASDYRHQIEIAQRGISFINLAAVKPKYDTYGHLFRIIDTNGSAAEFAKSFENQPGLGVNRG